MHTLSSTLSLACPILHSCTYCRAVSTSASQAKAQACSTAATVAGLGFEKCDLKWDLKNPHCGRGLG